MDQQASPSVQASLPIPRWEFIALAAALMALNALAIDIMLPGLPRIRRQPGCRERENHRQYVITAYIAGFGLAQLGFGPLSDRFGRQIRYSAGLPSMLQLRWEQPSRQVSRRSFSCASSRAPAPRRRA